MMVAHVDFCESAERIDHQPGVKLSQLLHLDKTYDLSLRLSAYQQSYSTRTTSYEDHLDVR